MFEQRACLDPYSRCALYGAATAVAGLSGIAVVTHAPQGCDLAVGSGFSYQNVDFTQRRLACTKLCENEVVSGGELKLALTLREAAFHYRPRAIVVLTGCAADIIGDDVEAVCARVEEETGIRVVPVLSGGFLGRQAGGADLALERVVDSLADEDEQGKGINLVAPFISENPGWMGDLAWVKRTMTRLGIPVNAVLTCRTPLSHLRRVPAASAGLMLSLDGGHGVLKLMYERFGVTPVAPDLPMPIGTEATARWLRNIADAFGVSERAERLIAREERRVVSELKLRYLPIHWFHRQPTAIVGDLTIGLGLAEFIVSELEMNLELFAVRPSAHPDRERLVRDTMSRLGIDPVVLFDADLMQVHRALQEIQPLSVFGSLAEEQMAPDIGLRYVYRVFDKVNRIDYFDYPYFGYDGMLKLLEIIINDWRGTNQRMSYMVRRGVSPCAADSNLWKGRHR